MYVKLVNPINKSTQVFEVPVGDVHYEPIEISQRGRDKWEESVHDAGWDPRAYMIWPGDPYDIDKLVLASRITIPGRRANQTVIVTTNWDAYLVHDTGRTVDRIHRHFPKEEAASA